MTDRETDLLNTLSTTRDAGARNAAAIALADLGSRRGTDAIRRLLHDPVTTGARGSLLYALRESNTRLGLGELVDLILTDAPEAREEAFSFLSTGLVENTTTADERRRAVERLRHAANENGDEDRRSLARDALELLA